MDESFVHGLAAFLQLLAVGQALYTIRISGRSLAWLLLSAAFLLQGARRVLEYFVARGGIDAGTVHNANTWLALAISLLMVIGIHRVREIFIARREAESAMAQSERLFRLLSDSATDCIFWTDQDMRYQYISPACQTLFGYAAQEFYADPNRMVLCIRPEDRAAYAAHLERGRAPDAGDLEFRITTADGAERWVSHTCVPIYDADRNYLGRRGSNRDITDRKRAQLEVKEYVEQLARTNAELQVLNNELLQAQHQLLQSEKMASVGLLAAGVAHEINNPIGFIASNLNVLGRYVDDFLGLIKAYERTASPAAGHAGETADIAAVRKSIDIDFEREDAKALLAESRAGIDHVKRIVQDLRVFSRVDGKETWREEDIHTVLDKALAFVSSNLGPKCEIKREYGALPPVQCLVFQLSQAFINLLVNAVQAIESQGTITLRTGTADDGVWIEISDTGKGIPPDELRRIFDPFFTTKPVGKGTGLGLWVSHSVVAKHHGRIDVESGPGKGTVFRLRLPLRQPERNVAVVNALRGR